MTVITALHLLLRTETMRRTTATIAATPSTFGRVRHHADKTLRQRVCGRATPPHPTNGWQPRTFRSCGRRSWHRLEAQNFSLYGRSENPNCSVNSPSPRQRHISSPSVHQRRFPLRRYSRRSSRCPAFRSRLASARRWSVKRIDRSDVVIHDDRCVITHPSILRGFPIGARSDGGSGEARGRKVVVDPPPDIA